MALALFISYLVVTFATSLLLAGRFLLPAKPAVIGIAVLVFWLCLLTGPVQCLALLDLAGFPSFLRASQLFFCSGLVFICALVLWLFRRKVRQIKQEGQPAAEDGKRIPWHVAAGLFIVIVTYGILALRICFSFPDTYDSVAYHYPVALRWLQESTMRITDAANWRAGLPGNNEILDLLVLSTGRERFLGCVQWPSVLILLLACLQLSRRLCQSAMAQWPVVTTVLMIPIVANQSFAGYVDLFGTALLFGSLTLLLEFCDQARAKGLAARPGLIFGGGLAAGLAVGTKPVFWFFAAVLVFHTYFLVLRHAGAREARRGLALFLVAAAVPSVFWFIRATVCTGNPFYPFAVHLGSISLVGVSPSEYRRPEDYLTVVHHWAEWFIYPWTEWKASHGFLLLNYTTSSGLGGGFATFVMPGVFFAGWLAKKRRPDLRPWLLALGLLALIWWFLLEKIARFGLPLFVLATIVSTPFFEVLESRATRKYRLVYVLVFTITACILVFEPLYTIAETIRYRHWTRSDYCGYPQVIDTLRPGSHILNLAPETFNLALAGSMLTNRVIPSWERPPTLTPSFLQSHHVDYLVEEFLSENDGTAVYKNAPMAGLEIYNIGQIKEGDKMGVWRIWSAHKYLSTRDPGEREFLQRGTSPQ